MTEDPTFPTQRAGTRAAARARRAKRIERREAWFELFASGYTHRQIADAMGASVATVRRVIDAAIDERRLDAPDRYIHVQLARLNRALSHADFKLAQGDHRAFAPYIKLVAELGRFHGLDGRNRQRLRAPRAVGSPPTPAPLALTCAASPLALAPAPGEHGAAPAPATADDDNGDLLYNSLK